VLAIRFQRTGRKKAPFYWLVVAEKSKPVQGRFLERLGYYNPLSKNKDTVFNTERIEHWISQGATPSQTVARLCVKQGISSAEKFIKDRQQKTSKADLEAAEKAKQAEEDAKKAAEEAAAAKKAEKAAEAAKAEENAAEAATEPAAEGEEKAEEKPAEEPKAEAPEDEPKA
jgi:small subunit ribosomal protein S16